MKLVISNIAWTNEEEIDVAQLLRELDVRYVEVAPTKRWQDPTAEATDEEIANYKQFWADYGIEIVAFQSMLFNRPDLKIFEEDTRQATLEYLKRFVGLAPKFGARAMVFGSPKNRQRGQVSVLEAEAISKDFFNELGNDAAANQTVFCIEPNPVEYACDFVTNAKQGIELVKKVNNPGFGLHLDIAGMTLAGDDVASAIHEAGPLLRHFHISAPFLGQVEDRDDVQYRAAAQALKDIDYQGFVSIEMRPEAAGANAERVKKAITFAQSVYSS